MALLILFNGCAGTKEYYKNSGVLKNITDAKLIKSTEEQYGTFESVFYKKFQAEIFIDGDRKSFKGNLFIEKDKAIIVSIFTLMNIELVRVRFSPGQVQVIDRTKKDYILSDYNYLWDKFLIEVDYEVLQDILLNELYSYPINVENRFDLKKYKHYRKDHMYIFRSIKKGKFSRLYRKESIDNIVLHEFSILPEVFKVKKSYIKDFNTNTTMTITYDNFDAIESNFMHRKLLIEGYRNNKMFKIDVNFPHIDLTGDHSIGFKVSDKYHVKDLINEQTN